jgi:NAD(P)-dependent dehydrogenase (short-subunit alcohol dehydrogenase family)
MKTVMITGATSDIGLACVENSLLSEQKVCAVFRKETNELGLLKENHKDNLELLKVDFLEKIQVENLLNKMVSGEKSIDSYIGLTAVRDNIDFVDICYDDLMKHFKVNVIPNTLIIKVLGQLMSQKKWGRIVVGGSIGVKFGGSSSSYCYSMTKYANEFIPKIAKKWSKNNVLYNVVRIGVTDTKRTRIDGRQKLAERVKIIPMKRAASPREIANFICWLCSDQNTYITGETLSITGGE